MQVKTTSRLAWGWGELPAKTRTRKKPQPDSEDEAAVFMGDADPEAGEDIEDEYNWEEATEALNTAMPPEGLPAIVQVCLPSAHPRPAGMSI